MKTKFYIGKKKFSKTVSELDNNNSRRNSLYEPACANEYPHLDSQVEDLQNNKEISDKRG